MFAALVYGVMSACTIPNGGGACEFLMQAHGRAQSKDCGTHELIRDDGTTFRITINCKHSKPE
jgi:hypothetical protein